MAPHGDAQPGSFARRVGGISGVRVVTANAGSPRKTGEGCGPPDRRAGQPRTDWIRLRLVALDVRNAGGEVRERLNRAVSKTVRRVSASRVRIPPSPPSPSYCESCSQRPSGASGRAAPREPVHSAGLIDRGGPSSRRTAPRAIRLGLGPAALPSLPRGSDRGSRWKRLPLPIRGCSVPAGRTSRHPGRAPGSRRAPPSGLPTRRDSAKRRITQAHSSRDCDVAWARNGSVALPAHLATLHAPRSSATRRIARMPSRP